MTTAIVMALNREHMLASPTGNVDLASMDGKRIVYRDSSDKEWPGLVTGIEDEFLVIRFENFPPGLGQGQVIEVLDGKD